MYSREYVNVFLCMLNVYPCSVLPDQSLWLAKGSWHVRNIIQNLVLW